jgi:putative zinc finger protein
MHEPVHDLDSLAAFVEGRLEGAARERVVAHLSACAECRRTVAQMGRALARGDLPHISRSAAARSRWQSPRVWVALAASALIGSFAWFYTASVMGPGRTPGSTDGDLLARRGAELMVEGKTFRETSGVWTDTSFDPSARLPSVFVRGPEERADRLDRTPELAPFADLGERVVVVWEGTVYHFEP